MDARRIQAAQFKARCLKLMDFVAETGEPLVITKRGKPVARLIAETPAKQSLLGRYEGQFQSRGDLTEPVFPAEDWKWRE